MPLRRARTRAQSLRPPAERAKPVRRTKSVLGQAGRPPTPKFDAQRTKVGKTIIDVLVDRRKAVEEAARIFRRRR